MESENDQSQPEPKSAPLEWLTQDWQEEPPLNTQDARLIQHLQRHYAKAKQEQILQRAWTSIAQKYEDKQPSLSQEKHAQNEQRKPERISQYRMLHITDQQVRQKQISRLGIFAAVAVIVLLIGGTAILMSHAAQYKGAPGTGSSGGKSPICTPIPTVAPSGAVPTALPSGPVPTVAPSGAVPTALPSGPVPTVAPSGSVPTVTPSGKPSMCTPTPTPRKPVPTVLPSGAVPTALPSGPVPTALPSGPVPTALPSGPVPTALPSGPVPTALPSGPVPTALPSGPVPTALPSGPVPTALPSGPVPTAAPSNH